MVKKKMGHVREGEVQLRSYEYKQIMGYSRKLFIDDMNENRILQAASHSDSSKIKAVFVSGFPLEIVLDEIDKNINPDNKLETLDGYTEEYYFRYSDCGMVDGEMCDYFKVVVLRGTKDILFMYPTKYGKKILPANVNDLSRTKAQSPHLRQRINPCV